MADIIYVVGISYICQYSLFLKVEVAETYQNIVNNMNLFFFFFLKFYTILICTVPFLATV
jgi:hypothetical protein